MKLGMIRWTYKYFCGRIKYFHFSCHLGSLVPEARLPCAQLSEVLCGSGHEVVKQLYLHPAEVLAIGRDLQVHLGPLLLA